MISAQPVTIAENLEISISFLFISCSFQTHRRIAVKLVVYMILKRILPTLQLEFQARFLRKSNCERAACRFQYLLRQL